jgi:hypothetical protein
LYLQICEHSLASFILSCEFVETLGELLFHMGY